VGGGKVIPEMEQLSCTNPRAGSISAMAVERALGKGSTSRGGLSEDPQIAAESVK